MALHVGVPALVLGVVFVVALFGYLRDNDEGLVNDVLADSEELIDALQVERSATFSRILGIEDPLGPSAREEAVARQTTDAAVAAFQATVSDHEDIRSDVDGALDALGDLASLRREIDGQPRAPSRSEGPRAYEVFGRYSDIVDVLLDADQGVVRSALADDGARRGYDLQIDGWRQLETLPRLRAAILSSPEPGVLPTPESIAEVARIHDELLLRQATVRDVPTGSPFEDDVTRLETDLESAGLAPVVEDALATGQVNTLEMLNAIWQAEVAWRAFVYDVDATG